MDELALMEKKTEDADFWGNPDSAQNHMQKLPARKMVWRSSMFHQRNLPMI